MNVRSISTWSLNGFVILMLACGPAEEQAGDGADDTDTDATGTTAGDSTPSTQTTPADDGVDDGVDDGPATSEGDDTAGTTEPVATDGGATTDGGGTESDTGATDTGTDTEGTTGEPISCIRFEDQETCEATEGCAWFGGTCVEAAFDDCEQVPAQALCDLTEGCEWDGRMCVPT